MSGLSEPQSKQSTGWMSILDKLKGLIFVRFSYLVRETINDLIFVRFLYLVRLNSKEIFS